MNDNLRYESIYLLRLNKLKQLETIKYITELIFLSLHHYLNFILLVVIPSRFRTIPHGMTLVRWQFACRHQAYKSASTSSQTESATYSLHHQVIQNSSISFMTKTTNRIFV